jgi:hypothetical protein
MGEKLNVNQKTAANLPTALGKLAHFYFVLRNGEHERDSFIKVCPSWELSLDLLVFIVNKIRPH